MSFVDPRDGDLEDDASSTAHHSLFGHASSILLEISLPKLAIAATLLLVVPAAIIGVAPKAALWFVGTAWDQVSGAERWLTLLAILALAALLGWRWGQDLFRATERNFWTLNAALVLPLYMAVREMVALLAERVAPTGVFTRARRYAGLVSGLLLGLLAALVALGVGPLPTLIIEDASPSGLLRAAGDSLRNGIWAVAVYLTVSAPAWSIAEVLAGTPADLEAAPRGASAWRVAHLSDLHVVGDAHGFRLECGRAGPRGNDLLHRTLAALAREDATRRLDRIIVSGDITDAGRNAEYIAFEDGIAAYPGLRERMLVIPGNHDVNIVDRANPARLELPVAPGGALRRMRFLAAMARLQGTRVHLVDRRAGRIGPTLTTWLAEHGRGDALARFVDQGGWRAGRAARTAWDMTFPLIAPPPAPDGLGVVLLDSNAETHFSFTNALGMVGMAQLRAAEAAMGAYPSARWLVVLHHHVVEYPRPGTPLADRIGTALVNGHWVLRRLRRLAPRILVLHGHRHVDWAGQSRGLRILSASSPVMGTRPTAWIHHLAPTKDGGLLLLRPTRLDLAMAVPSRERR